MNHADSQRILDVLEVSPPESPMSCAWKPQVSGWTARNIAKTGNLHGNTSYSADVDRTANLPARNGAGAVISRRSTGRLADWWLALFSVRRRSPRCCAIISKCRSCRYSMRDTRCPLTYRPTSAIFSNWRACAVKIEGATWSSPSPIP